MFLSVIFGASNFGTTLLYMYLGFICWALLTMIYLVAAYMTDYFKIFKFGIAQKILYYFLWLGFWIFIVKEHNAIIRFIKIIIEILFNMIKEIIYG